MCNLRAVISECDHHHSARKPLRDVPRPIQRMMLELHVRFDATMATMQDSCARRHALPEHIYLPETEKEPGLVERLVPLHAGQEIELVRAETEIVGILDVRLWEIIR